MRVPVWLAWVILGSSVFTSGLLRGFHEGTPKSPYVDPAVGSLLFAGLVVLLLVTAREHRRGAVGGTGVRLGSLTPLLLMLFVEKWVSLTAYSPIFAGLLPDELAFEAADARFRAFAGVGLLAVCLLVGRFSIPTARKTWRRARPARWPVAALQCGIVIVGTYVLLGAAAAALGGELRLAWPRTDSLWLWILGGQALLAFAEEVYYRGLLLSEIERLAPRLGGRGPTARRWIALLLSAFVFGLEHLRLGAPGAETVRHMVFTVSLALLLGLLVMISANLHLAGGVHAWINWLLLGAAPHFVDASGDPALPSGTYIGLTLVLAFVSSFLVRRLPHRPGTPGAHGLRAFPGSL